MMKCNYIIFFETVKGKSQTFVKLDKKIKELSDLNDIEDEIAKKFDLDRAYISNFKYVGKTWK